MKKFEGVLLATDLDGTLLRNDKSLSEENKQAIEYFKSEGGRFTFITGRAPVAITALCELLCPNAPIGCMNGGEIYDYEKKELLWYVSLPTSVLELVEFVDHKLPHTGIEVITHKNILFCKKNAFTEKHRTDESLPDITCKYTEVKDPIAKLLFADSPENIEIVKEKLLAHPRISEFAPIRSDHIYYEILPLGINKGTIIKKLPEIIGDEIKKTIAVGDNDNDASMLAEADLGIAVSNASDKTKKAARHLTVSNEQHAIAKIIYDLEKGNISF